MVSPRSFPFGTAILCLIFSILLDTNNVFSQCAGGGTSIASEGFEGAYTGSGEWGSGYVSSAPGGSCTMGSDNFGLLGSLSSISPNSGSQFWGMQDIDGNCGSSAGETLTFTHTVPANATYTEVEICFYYTVIGYDTGDDIFTTIEVDGVAPCAEVDNFQVVDGLNSTSGGPVTVPWTQLCQVVTVAPGQVVTFEILADQNGGSDYGGIDDVTICEGGSSANSCPSAMCEISNVVVQTDGACSGVDATYTVCADITGGSGDYDLIDTGNGNAILSALTGQATDGTVCFPVTISGPTTSSTIMVDVVDNMDATCVGGTPATVTIPECPMCVDPPAPTLTDITVCDGGDTEIVVTPVDGPVTTTQIFSETFTTDGEGVIGACTGPLPSDCATNVPPANGLWMVTGSTSGLTATSDFFVTSGGVLVAQDVDQEICITTTSIDISGCDMASFSVDLAEFGDHEGSDYIDVTYIVDGVSTTITDWMGLGDSDHTLIDDWNTATVTQTGIVGSSLVIEICVLNGAGSEIFNIDNIIVDCETASTVGDYNFYDADPAGGTANLLAGPASSYDPMTTTATSPQTVYVTCVNEDGCEGPAAPIVITVNENPVPMVSDQMACPGGTATLDAGTYNSYFWGTGATTQTITVAAGSYMVTVTDANGCTGSTSATVTEFASPNPSVAGISVCPGATGVLDAGVWNAYSWSTGATTQTITVGAGTYTVTITDANGCTGTTSAVVTEYASPSPSVTSISVCPGATGVLDAGLWNAHSWSTGATTQTITVGAGTYMVTVTDANGCTGATSATVSEYTPPSPSLTNQTVCPGGAATLDPGIYASYLWSTGATSQTITVGVGTYMVTVTDANGCTGTATGEITESSILTTALTDAMVCPGGTITLNPGVFNSYIWSNGATTQMITVGPGVYEVTVTDASGCEGTGMSTISEFTPPSPVVTGVSVCPGANGTLDAGAWSAYIWSTGATTQTITAGAGTYMVTVTDANGCTGTTSGTISEFTPPSPVVAGVSVCPGANGTLDAGAWSAYIWSTGATTQTITAGAGTYMVTVTDANGCTGSATGTISEFTSPSPVVTGVSVCPGANGTLDAGAWSAYIWSTGATTQTITAGAGTYMVTVTDANGCTGTTSGTISEFTPPSPVVAGVSVCPGANGILDAGAWSAYIWSTGATTQTITAGAGTYMVTVTDANGCTGTTSGTISEFTPPSPVVAGVSVCPGANGILDAGAWSAYIWSTGATTQTITAGAGTYMVTVTDANGCTGSATGTISEFTSPSPVVAGVSVCPGANGTLDAGAWSAYIWSTGATTQTITAGAGTYMVTVTDANGCTGSATGNISEFISPAPMLDDAVVCAGGTTILDAGTFSSYTWSTGATTQSISQGAGTYMVTVTDANGCTGATSASVVERELSNASVTQTCVDASNYDLEVCFEAINPGPSDMFTIEIDGTSYGTFTYSGNVGMGANEYCVTLSGLDPTDMETGLVVTITDSDPTAAFTTVFQDMILAFTSFEEGAVGNQYVDTGDAAIDHDLVNNPGESEVDFMSTGGEMGFDATYLTTGSNGLTDGDFVGVANFTGTVGAYTDGTQGYQMSDTDGIMVLTFDPVDISACTDVELSLDYFVQETGWESSDLIIIAVNVDGTDIDLLNTTGADIDDLMIEDAWMNASTTISGTTATLSVTLQSNSSSEAIYFDNVVFSGNNCMTADMALEMCMTNTSYNEEACFMCPTIGAISNLSPICDGETFDVTASDIFGVDMMTNLDMDYSIEFVYFAGAGTPANPYMGGTTLATVPFSGLVGPVGGPYEAMLTGQTLSPGTYQICAILEPDPSIDPDCRPSICTSITINDLPDAPIIEDIEVCEGESTEINLGSGVASLPFIETFDTAGEGLGGACVAGVCATDVPASNGQWMITGDETGLTATSDFILTNGGSLNAQDLDTELCFETSVIDISGYSGVNFSIDISEFGDHESADYVNVTYIVDGVPTTITNWMNAGSATSTLVGDLALGGTSDDADWGSTTVTAGNILGSTLVIQVCMLNNAGSETISLDNLIVDGNANVYNFYDADPLAGGNLLAGGVISYDPMTAAGTTETLFVSCFDSSTGCESSTTEVMITVNPGVVVVCSATDVLCFGEATGSVEVTASNGTPAYTYAWSNGATTAINNGLSVGTYTVTVTDANGCSAVCSSIFSEPTLLSAVCTGQDVGCNGESNGSAMVVASGGTAPYSYMWSNGGSMATEIDLSAGTYSVTVTDANGCTAECETIIEEPTPIEAEVSCGCALNAAGTQIVPVVTISGFTGGLPDMDGSSYTISSSDGTVLQTTATIGGTVTMELNDITGGAYTISIVDDTGCELILDGTCDDCGFSEFIFADPCSCNGDQSENGAMDGTFSETVQIFGPGGFSLVVGAGSTGMLGVNIGDAIPQVLVGGVYEITFDHLDNVGYELFVEIVTPAGTTIPLLDANGNQVFGINACQYPILTEPNLDPVDFCQTDEAVDVTGIVTEILGHPGTITATVNGATITSFDPSNFGPGIHLIQWTFVGDFVNDQGGTQADPAIPGGVGCGTFVTQQVTVHSGGQLNCNNHVNISLDENCGLGPLSADIFMEGAGNNQFFGYRILDALGNPIDEADLGNFIGQTLNYEVFDVCTGNICWGTVTLEDKIAPTIDCECETPYLTDGVTPNPDCTFRCYEIWDLEELEDPQRGNNEILPDVDDNTPEDNCYEFGDPAVAFSYSEGPNCGEQIVTRQLAWTYIDELGQTQYLTCTQNFLFDNLELNSIGSTANGAWDGYPDIFTATSGDNPILDIYTPEQEVYLTCGAGTDPADIAAAYDIDTPGRPAGIDRDDHSQTPNLIEHNEGIPYAYPYVVQAGWAGRFHAKPIDNNICNIWTVYSDLSYDACAEDCFGNSKIARSWTILDWCTASTIEFVQTIKRIDQEGPAVSGPDFTVSVDPWGCTANFEVPEPEHLLDNCDKEPKWSVVGPIGIEIVNGYALDLPKGTTTLTYVAEDCCGNQSFFPFNVTVEDRTAPTAIALQNIVVQLSNDQDGDGHAKLYAVDVDNASHDGCTDVHFEIRRNGNDWCNPGSNTSYNNDDHPDDLDTDVDNGEYVIFCCEDAIDVDSNGVTFGIHDVILRVWDDGDMDGVFGTEGDNYNEIWTTVKVEDKSEPVVVCPPHIELSCNEDYLNYELTGRPYGFSTCGDIVCDMEPSDNFRSKNASQPPFVGEAIPAYNPSCRRGAIQRTWSCEGKTCTQWIIMRDTEDGDLEITWPEDKESDCIDIDAGEPDIVERLCELSGTSLESDTFYFEDGACYKILNHWTVINWCDYDADDTDLNDQTDDDDDGFVPGLYTHTQVLKLIDTEKPTITTQDSCFAVNADCVGEGIQIWAGGADNGICSSAWLKWEAEVDMNSDWVVDYTFSSWFAPDDPFYIAPTAGDVHIDLPDGLPNGCASTHRVRWTVSDGCGNDTQATSFFTIEDKKKPTPYMLNLSTALMADGSVELWASDFDTGSFDNCSPQDFLLFTFSSTVPPQLLDPEEEDPWYDADGVASENDYNNGNAELWDGEAGTSAMVFTDEDLAAAEANGGLLEVPVYVWDLCGNSDFAIVNLQLVDNGGSANIEGRVATEAGIGVEGVTMTATSAQAGYPATTMTEADGEYMFEFNPMYNDYTLTGEKNDDWLNGVTTLDILLIQRHILSIEELDSPYKMIAADASNDEKISAVDLIQLRKLILGLTSELPNNDSWRFTDADASMDSSNPWPFSEFVNVTDLQSNMVENFVATKVGDVNGSVELFLQGHSTDTRSEASLNMNIEQSALAQGITELRFKSSNFSEISGFQFTLEANVTEIVELTSGLLTIEEGNVGLVDGALTMSWNTSKMVSYGEDVLFTLKVKKSDSKVSLSDRITQTEAYQGSGFEAIKLILEEAELAINSLGQNEPNPWRAETVINFSLAEAGTTSITVYDVTGKVLFVTEADYTAGTHEVNLKGRDLTGAAGVLYYKLESGEFSDTKKMILIE